MPDILEAPPAGGGRRFIRTRHAFKQLDISDATGWRWVAAGILPRPYALGPKIRAFDADELAKAVEKRIAALAPAE
jgi:predicted DNA-binding transcriptional regulator AlpA